MSEFGTTPITVVISVSDTNDPPQFEQTMYSVTVVENSPIGHNIIQIKATDPDSGALGQITYSSDGKHFIYMYLEIFVHSYFIMFLAKCKKRNETSRMKCP